MSEQPKNPRVVAPVDVIDPQTNSFVRGERLRALDALVSMLPFASRTHLTPFLNNWKNDSSEDAELELFSELRTSLNEASVQGALGRREFLKIAGLLMTSGLGAMIFPQSAEAMYNMGAFWKKKKAAAGSTGGGTSTEFWGSGTKDPYWDNVALLMHLDGANGATTMADESNVGKSPTTTGDIYVDTVTSSISGQTGSLKLTGSNALNFPTITDLDLTADFTIEAWVRFSANPGAGNSGFCIYSNRSILFYVVSTSLVLDIGNNTISYNAVSGAWTPSLNTWYHVAATRSGNVYRIFVNGAKVGEATNTNTVGTNAGSAIGRYITDNNRYFVGNIADLRIYKSIAKYTAAFTAPSRTAGLGSAKDSNWANCVLACPFDNTLRDMSGGRATATSATLLTATKKIGTASAYFSGSGSAVDITTTGPQLSAGDFTIEMYFYPVTLSGTRVILCQTGGSVSWATTSGLNWELYTVGATDLTFAVNNAGSPSTMTVTHGMSTGNWYHVAVCKVGTTVSIYVDGALKGSSTSLPATISVPTSCGYCSIGREYPGGYNSNCYVDSLRITKGYARYASNFTPPTAAFPIGKDESLDPFWGYVVSLVQPSASATSVTDTTGRRSAAISGSVSVSGSGLFAETTSITMGGGWIDLASSSDFSYGTGAFTIEFFFKSNATSGNVILFDQRIGSYNVPTIYLNGAYSLRLYSSADLITSSRSITPGAIHHVAVTRVGTVTSLYLDGTLVGQKSDDSNNYATSALRLGADLNGAGAVSGNIFGVRVTKGVARYVQNFNPPTCGFATSASATAVTLGEYDPFWSSVVLLQHMDGTNGSTSITDSSLSPKSSTAYGGAQISASASKFGGQSLSLNGSTAYVDTALGSILPNNVYTMECWIKTSATGNMNVLSFGVGFDFYLINNAMRLSNGVYLITGTQAINDDNWHHVALVSDGTYSRIFVDGVQDGSTYTGALTLSNGLRIGMQAGSSNFPFNGSIDEVRITAGQARYQASFVPPRAALPSTASMPTGTSNIVTSGLVAYLDAGDINSYPGGGQKWRSLVTTDPYWSRVVLLMSMDGSNGGTSFSDLSDSAATITNSGSVTTNTSTVKFGASSASFSNSGVQYLQANISSKLPTSEDFTLELWAYFNTGAAYAQLISTRSSGSSGIVMSRGNSPNIGFSLGNGGAWIASVTQTDNSFTDNTWHHVAVVRSGSTVTLYVDGSNKGSSAISGSLAHQNFTVGYDLGNPVSIVRMHGFIDDLRITVGVARYTSNFSVPTEAYPVQNAYDFYLGSASSSEASDPTFIGIAGGRSANDYFAVDGGDYFTFAGSSTAFIDSLHKAGAQYTICAVVSLASAKENIFFATGGVFYYPGVSFQTSGANYLSLQVGRSGSLAKSMNATTHVLPLNKPVFVALSYDETGNCFFYVNGEVPNTASGQTWSGTYSGPSSAAANYPPKIGVATNGSNAVDVGYCSASGSKFYLLNLYNRALTKAELDQNFAALRSRYGI